MAGSRYSHIPHSIVLGIGKAVQMGNAGLGDQMEKLSRLFLHNGKGIFHNRHTTNNNVIFILQYIAANCFTYAQENLYNSTIFENFSVKKDRNVI